MILTTLSEFSAAVPTAATVKNYADLETYVKSAELWLKSNVLGTTLYNLIAADGFADADLIERCQSVIANHAYWDAIPFLDVVHTDAGFGVISATNKAPASKERIERLREQCLLRRDSEVDLLIDYLWEHTDYHDEWQSSETYAQTFNSILPTLKIAQKYLKVENKETFDKMRSSIVSVQNGVVADTISFDYVNYLVEAVRDGDLTANDNTILDWLREAVAKLGMAEALANLSVTVDENGISMARSDFKQNYARDSRLEMMATNFKRAGMTMLNRVVDYMVKNIANYTVFANSTEYAARTTAGYENDADSPIFSSLF